MIDYAEPQDARTLARNNPAYSFDTSRGTYRSLGGEYYSPDGERATSDSTRYVFDNSMTPEELDSIRPTPEEALSGTDKAKEWYNEAVETAARLFLIAGERSDRFREAFLSGETESVQLFNSSVRTVEVDVWRRYLNEDCPDVADDLWAIELSASQGGFAERRARTAMNETPLSVERETWFDKYIPRLSVWMASGVAIMLLGVIGFLSAFGPVFGTIVVLLLVTMALYYGSRV